MDLFDIENEVEICIQRVRAINVMAEALLRRDPDTANAISRVACDADDGIVGVRDALIALRKAAALP